MNKGLFFISLIIFILVASFTIYASLPQKDPNGSGMVIHRPGMPTGAELYIPSIICGLMVFLMAWAYMPKVRKHIFHKWHSLCKKMRKKTGLRFNPGPY